MKKHSLERNIKTEIKQLIELTIDEMDLNEFSGAGAVAGYIVPTPEAGESKKKTNTKKETKNLKNE